jgi:hypothetical protein
VLGHEAPAFSARHEVYRLHPAAVFAVTIIMSDLTRTAGTERCPSPGSQRREKDYDDDQQGEKKAGQRPKEDVPTFLCSEQTADGSRNQLKNDKPSHKIIRLEGQGPFGGGPHCPLRADW